MTNKNKQYIFNINDLNIKVESNDGNIIDDLINLYGDYYNIGTTEDFCINYIVGQNIKKGFPYKEKNQNKYNYIEKTDLNLNVYMDSYSEDDKDFIKRIFTTSLVKLLQSNGYTIIHGACVASGNDAVIISGDKRCGKTTTMMNLLNRNYDYIANDRLAIKQEGQKIIVIGIPFSLGIIAKDAKKTIDTHNLKTDIDGEEQKIYIENNMISQKLNVNVKSIAYVKAIIIPSKDIFTNSIIVKSINNPISILGNNIMTYNSIPDDKNFLNIMFPINYKNYEYINYIPTYLVTRSLKTFDELDKFIKEHIIGDKKDVLRLTRSFK